MKSIKVISIILMFISCQESSCESMYFVKGTNDNNWTTSVSVCADDIEWISINEIKVKIGQHWRTLYAAEFKVYQNKNYSNTKPAKNE